VGSVENQFDEEDGEEEAVKSDGEGYPLAF
jgi:hypothetical protein